LSRVRLIRYAAGFYVSMRHRVRDPHEIRCETGTRRSAGSAWAGRRRLARSRAAV